MATATRPAAGTATADPFAALQLDVGSARPAAGTKPGQPAGKPLKKSREFAGLPIGFWLLALGGLVLAVGLGIQLLMKP